MSSVVNNSVVNSELLSEHNAEERHPQDFEIESPRAVFKVEQVVAQTAEHLLHGVGIAVVKGGVGSNPGTYLKQVTVTGIAFHNLVDVILTFGTGADESHLSEEYVPKLGQFVEMVFAQELADLGKTFVLAAGIKGRTVFFGIELHAAELVDIERTSEAPDAFLLENGRTAVFAFYGNVAYQKQRREHDKGDESDEAVHAPFYITFEAVHPVGNVMIVFFYLFKIHKIVYKVSCFFQWAS